MCIKRLICFSASLTSHPEMRDVDKEEISVDFSKVLANLEHNYERKCHLIFSVKSFAWVIWDKDLQSLDLFVLYKGVGWT